MKSVKSKIGAYVYPVNPQAVLLAKAAYEVDDPRALTLSGELTPDFWQSNFGILSTGFWKDQGITRDGKELTQEAFLALRGQRPNRMVRVGQRHGRPTYLWLVGDPNVDSKMAAKNVGGFQLTPIAPEEWKDFLTIAKAHWAKDEAIQFVVPSTPVEGRFLGAELQEAVDAKKPAGEVAFQGDSEGWYGAGIKLRSLAFRRFLARQELVKTAGVDENNRPIWMRAHPKTARDGRTVYPQPGPDEYYDFAPPTFAALIAQGHADIDRVEALNEALTVGGVLVEEEAAEERQEKGKKAKPVKQKKEYIPKTEGIPWRAVDSVVAVVYGRSKEKGAIFGPVARKLFKKSELPDPKERGKRGLSDFILGPIRALLAEKKLATMEIVIGAIVDISLMPDAPKERVIVDKGVRLSQTRRAVLCSSISAWSVKRVVEDGETLDKSRMTASPGMNEFKNQMMFQDLLGCGFNPDGVMLRPLSNLFAPSRVTHLKDYQKSVASRAEDGKGPPDVQTFLHFRLFPQPPKDLPDVVVAARGAGDALGRAALYGGPQGTVRLRTAAGGKGLEEYAPPGVHAVNLPMQFSKFLPYALELSAIKSTEEAPSEDVVIEHRAEKPLSPVSSDVFALLRSRGIPHPPENSDWSDPRVRDAMEKAILHMKTFLYGDRPAQGALKKEKRVEAEEWRQKLLRANPQGAKPNPQTARTNPLTGSDQAKIVEEWIRSEGKADNQAVENIFEEIRKKSSPDKWKLVDLTEDPRTKKLVADKSTNIVEQLFPKKGNLHDYKPEKRIPALEKQDLIARVDYPARTGPQREEEEAERVREERQLASSSNVRPQTLDYLLKQAELTLVDTQRVMSQQRKTRESKFTMQSSTALLKDFKIRRLAGYSPPSAFMTAGGPNKIVIVISPVADRLGRVMTFRRNHHLDLDIAPKNPRELSLGKLVGKALMSALLWIAENPSKRASNTAIYVTRVGAGYMTLAWQPGDELTLGAIAKRLKSGDGPAQRWNGTEDEHSYMSALNESQGRRRRRYRDDLYEQESIRVTPVETAPETEEAAEAPSEDPWGAFYGLSGQDVAPQEEQSTVVEPPTAPQKKQRAPRKARTPKAKPAEEVKENPSFWKKLFSW